MRRRVYKARISFAGFSSNHFNERTRNSFQQTTFQPRIEYFLKERNMNNTFDKRAFVKKHRNFVDYQVRARLLVILRGNSVVLGSVHDRRVASNVGGSEAPYPERSNVASRGIASYDSR